MNAVSLPAGFKEIDFHHYYQTTPCPRGRMRCLAMLHLQQGKTVGEAARCVQQSRISVSIWLRWLREEGGFERLIGFAKGRGRKPKLSFEKCEILRSTIEKAAKDRKGGRIVGREVQKLIQETWGVKYALSSIYVVLSRLNLVWITSRSQHPQMDPALQEEFKKTSFKK